MAGEATEDEHHAESCAGHAHAHGAGHDHHGHSHSHRGTAKKRLAATLVLVLVYMLAEVIGSRLSNSLALLADAGHMLSDAAALGLSLFAVWIAQRPATSQQSYGYYRAEILATLANGSTLVAVSLFIFYEAYQRLWEPPEIRAPLMIVIAVGGLAMNLASLWILKPSKSENLNIRSAWLHVMADALGSVATIVDGLLVWTCGWVWADPIASMLIGLLVIHSSWNLLKESIAILMESTPGHIDLDQVRSTMLATPGVQEVHDLHIWTITSGLVALSGHVVADEGQPYHTLLKALRDELHEHFGIDHITIQIEPENFQEHRHAF
jgi:cobalt-zinc-cadmium efflux system protein